MADTPTTRYGARKQSLGSNTNTHGDPKLNEDLDLFDRGSKGYQALTVTGDATLSWTNYIATNDGQVATLKLAGTPVAAFTLTFPSTQWELDVINTSGQTATLKCSGGTGISIPTGRTVRLYCDATDIFSKVANYLPTATTLTNAQDLVSKLQMETAIAAAGLPATAGTVLNSATDPAANFLANKLAASSAGALSLTVSTTNPGTASEKSTFTGSVSAMAFSEQAEQTAGFTAAVGSLYPVNIATTGTILFPAAPVAKDKVAISNYGAGNVTFNWNSLKYNGATTSLVTNAKGLAIFIYTNASTGWVDA